MKSNGKEIKSISTGSICMQSSPCQHDATITYQDGSTKRQSMNAIKIAALYETKPDSRYYNAYLSYKKNEGKEYSCFHFFRTKDKKENNTEENNASARFCVIL